MLQRTDIKTYNQWKMYTIFDLIWLANNFEIFFNFDLNLDNSGGPFLENDFTTSLVSLFQWFVKNHGACLWRE